MRDQQPVREGELLEHGEIRNSAITSHLTITPPYLYLHITWSHPPSIWSNLDFAPNSAAHLPLRQIPNANCSPMDIL